MSSFKKKHDRIKILGIYVLLSAIVNIGYNLIVFNDPFQFLWYCDFAGIILGTSLLKKNKAWVSAIFMMSLAGQAFWILDFFLEVMGAGMGRTALMLQWGIIDTILTVNLHSIIIPISLYGVPKLGFSKKSLGPMVVTVVILFSLSFVISDMEDNINCVFYPCDQPYNDEVYFYKPYHYDYLLVNVLAYRIAVVIALYCALRWVIFRNSKKRK